MIRRLNHAEISEQTRKNCTPFERKGEKMGLTQVEKDNLFRVVQDSGELSRLVECIEAVLNVHVEQAVLAAEAAENEACAKEAESLYGAVSPIGPLHGAGISDASKWAANAIRSRMTQPRAAALEKVREEAMAPLLALFSDYEEPCESVEAARVIWNAVILRSRKAEAEAKRLREVLKAIQKASRDGLAYLIADVALSAPAGSAPTTEQLLARAVSNRGTPKDINAWAKKLADDVKDADD